MCIVCFSFFLSSSEDIQSLLMTSVDLCAMYKTWDVQRNIVNTIMDEFWLEVWIVVYFDENEQERETEIRLKD